MRALQERLATLGYTETGAPDGIFGPATEAAVRRFQQEHGLEADGIAGEKTWSLLFGPAADRDAQTAQTWYAGMTADEAKAIETRLQALDYEICSVDRTFSEQTAAAVRQFQAVNGLEADGVVGPQTWEALFGEQAAPAPQGVALTLARGQGG